MRLVRVVDLSAELALDLAVHAFFAIVLMRLQIFIREGFCTTNVLVSARNHQGVKNSINIPPHIPNGWFLHEAQRTVVLLHECLSNAVLAEVARATQTLPRSPQDCLAYLASNLLEDNLCLLQVLNSAFGYLLQLFVHLAQAQVFLPVARVREFFFMVFDACKAQVAIGWQSVLLGRDVLAVEVLMLQQVQNVQLGLATKRLPYAI